MIIGIVAIARNYAIGKGGKLPWHHPADLKLFKETTSGNAVVMGANTWRAIGKPLPNRFNIVLSATSSVTPPTEVLRLSEKEEVLDFARYLNRDLFVIGGAQVYRDLAESIEKWIVTWVPDEVPDADTFLPQDFLEGFAETQSCDLGDGLIVKTLSRK